MDLGSFASWIVSFFRVTGSTVSGPHFAVSVGGEGAADGAEEGSTGEADPSCEAFGAPGIVFRPRLPEEVDTPDGTETLSAESYAVRTGDGMVPLAWRDLRFNRAFPAPKPGSVSFVGYGGGFFSQDDTETNCGDQKATLQTLYVPYAFSGGVPAKAHCIIVDPENEDIKIIQGDGNSVLVTKDGVVIRSANGANRIEISDAGINLVGIVNVVGTMTVGIDPLVPPDPSKFAFALAVGPGTPPMQPCLCLKVSTP